MYRLSETGNIVFIYYIFGVLIYKKIKELFSNKTSFYDAFFMRFNPVKKGE